MAEGIACYKTFISGLLDITDNLVDGETVPPRDVVRHDGDDSYLVVAADKGTATFSDIANGVVEGLRLLAGRRVRVGRLGRLRPQGDGHHRARRLGLGPAALPRARDRLPGRGLHRGRHRRHVRRRLRQRHAAAPSTSGWWRPSTTATSSSTPTRTPSTSYAERKRLFALPRSSWQDYDRDLISEGGGVYSAIGEVDPAQPGGPRRPRHRGRRRGDDARRADEGDPAGAGRPALERRHRHLRQGIGRDPRRRRRQGQRRDPRRRRGPALPLRRRGRQPRADPARPDRVRPPRTRRRGRPDQHRLHRQLRRRGHLRPRGEHQDPARPHRARRAT